MPLPSALRDERQVGTLRCHFVLLATLPGAARLGVDCGASLALGVRVVAAWLSCACAMCACTGGADEGAEDGVAAGGGAAGHSAPGGRWGWCRALWARDAASVGEGGGGQRVWRGVCHFWGLLRISGDVCHCAPTYAGADGADAPIGLLSGVGGACPAGPGGARTPGAHRVAQGWASGCGQSLAVTGPTARRPRV